MAMLGAMLVNRKAVGRVLQHLDSSDGLALAEHRVIFDAICKLHFAGRPADAVVLKSVLSPEQLAQVGGPAYLNSLVDCAVTPINAGAYAEHIRSLYLRREWIDVGTRLHDWGYSGESEEPAPEEALERIDGLRWQRHGGRIQGIEQYEFGELHMIESPKVEPLLGGWLHRQSRAFITGAKKTGKSFLTMEIARAVGLGVGFLHWQASGKPTRVLYVDGELGLDASKKREESFRKRYGDGPMNVTMLNFDRYPVPPIDTTAGHQMILNAADQVGAGLVIIDNYTALTDESLSDDVTVKRIRPLLNELMTRRIASISVAHAGHNETRLAGSHVMGALTTGILHLTRDEESKSQAHCFGTMTWQATREATPEDQDYRNFSYEIRDGGFVEMGESGAGRRKPKSAAERWALEQLDQCLHLFGQVLVANSVRPAGMSAVSRGTFIEWLVRRGEGTAEDAAKTIKILLLNGWIAKDGDFLWRV